MTIRFSSALPNQPKFGTIYKITGRANEILEKIENDNSFAPSKLGIYVDSFLQSKLGIQSTPVLLADTDCYYVGVDDDVDKGQAIIKDIPFGLQTADVEAKIAKKQGKSQAVFNIVSNFKLDEDEKKKISKYRMQKI